jgi:hypothetical protein
MLNVECSIHYQSENSTLLIHHSTLRSLPLRCYPTMQIFSWAMAAESPQQPQRQREVDLDG